MAASTAAQETNYPSLEISDVQPEHLDLIPKRIPSVDGHCASLIAVQQTRLIRLNESTRPIGVIRAEWSLNYSRMPV